MDSILINPETGVHKNYNNALLAEFLEIHLERFGDKQTDILKCIQYALNPDRGGFVVVGLEGQQMIGAVVVNKTGMDGYIPSNILVYIAVHKDHRGKGYGKALMKEAMSKTTGGIALHVEADNPAKILYEQLGFTNKYLEMRFQPSK